MRCLRCVCEGEGEREREREHKHEGGLVELVLLRYYFCVCPCHHVICRFAFVEFAMPESVPIALQYNGAMFGDRPIK